MRFPGAQTDPAEFHPAVGLLADHMIAAAVLLDGHLTLGALLCVGRDPVERLRIVITFLFPLLEYITLNRLVPAVTTQKAKQNRFGQKWSGLRF